MSSLITAELYHIAHIMKLYKKGLNIGTSEMYVFYTILLSKAMDQPVMKSSDFQYTSYMGTII